VLAVDVLDAPEAARGDGAALCAVGDGSGCGGGVADDREPRALRDGPRDAGEEVCEGHGCGEEKREDGAKYDVGVSMNSRDEATSGPVSKMEEVKCLV
jgi:hypothetical protein